jgi:hypothetical protein
MGRAGSTDEMMTNVYRSENLKERDHLEDLGIDRKIL